MRQAKDTDPNCYKAWHAFACTNFEALLLYRGAREDGSSVDLRHDNWGGETSDSVANRGTPVDDDAASLAGKRVSTEGCFNSFILLKSTSENYSFMLLFFSSVFRVW